MTEKSMADLMADLTADKDKFDAILRRIATIKPKTLAETVRSPKKPKELAAKNHPG